MPTTYAHWQFGRDCISKLPKNLQKIVNENRDIFDIGVHGPDIFFYDLLHSKNIKYGSWLHNVPAWLFFNNCKEVYEENGQKDQMLAYMLGFLSHFTLDSHCHSYVEIKKEVSGISHTLIESQFDRYLITKDHRVPNLVDRSESLKPNRENAKIISLFYPFNPHAILRACKMQTRIVRLSDAISIRKQNFFQKLLRKFHIKDYDDLFIGFEEYESCKDSNLRLEKLKNKALKLYPKLANNLIKYLNDDEDLDKYFDHDLCCQLSYKEMMVLPYEEELKYVIK